MQAVDRLQIWVKFLMIGVLAYFATSLILFANEARQFRQAIDNLVVQIGEAGKTLDVPQILERVDTVAQQIEQTREMVPEILAEVEKTRDAIPPVLKQIELTRRAIPSILDESAKIREEIPPILHEVAQARELVPQVLQESAAIRADVPTILDKSEQLISKAQQVSSDMGTGVVKGTVKGVVTAPITIIETGLETLGSGIDAVSSQTSKILDIKSSEPSKPSAVE